MILLLNQKHNVDFIYKLFNSPSKFYEHLIQTGKQLPLDEKSLQIKSVINSLFLEEYKYLFYRTPPLPLLESLFMKEQLKAQKTFLHVINPFPNETYHIILDYLINFCISYDNIDNSLCKDDEYIEINKETITQSIVRIVFSKEKYDYLYIDKSNRQQLSEEQYDHYEYYFIQRLIYKSIYEIKNNDLLTKIEKAFNVENIYNDILKSIFKLYGNETIKSSYLVPLNELVEIIDEYGDGLNIGAVEEFMERFINGLKSMPKVLKMILFLLHDVSCELLVVNKSNYNIIYALLINSFILSPTVHTLFNNKINKVSTIINIEKIIKSICYGNVFSADDNLNEFNETVKYYHKEMIGYVENNILNVDKDGKGKLKMKSYLRNIAKNKEFVIPKFVFYIDCQNILSILPCVQIGNKFNILNKTEEDNKN